MVRYRGLPGMPEQVFVRAVGKERNGRMVDNALVAAYHNPNRSGSLP